VRRTRERFPSGAPFRANHFPLYFRIHFHQYPRRVRVIIMSDWITISPTDLYDYLAAEQAEALRSAALGAGQNDPLPTLIADVVARIRAEIAGCAANTLSPAADSIPAELRGAALALIVEAAEVRLPSLELSDDQVRLANAARALLKRVADGDLRMTYAASGAGNVVVGRRAGFVTGRSLSGL
jgi:hypothetical protein